MATAIITGGTRGIGRVLSRHFLEKGYSVVACSRSEDSLQQAREEFCGDRGSFVALQGDVSKEVDVIRVVDTALSRFKKIDVLINNAGVYGPVGKFFESTTESWVAAFQTNMFGTFYCCKHCVPHMRANGFGRIINLSGGGATNPMPHYSLYSASKAALVRFTETIALELAGFGIMVNAIAPGFIATGIHEETLRAGQNIVGDFFEKTRARVEEGGDDPSRAAKLALFLASGECRITGKLISAIFDPWEALTENWGLDKDLYTLRRIDDVFFGKIGNG